MPLSRRCCVNNPNTFCYICGEYVVKKFRKPITDSVKKTYIDYFKIERKALKNLGCNMSIKVHYLDNHLDKFPENLGAYSEEQGERFHQDLKVMGDRYQGRWDEHMMADYCWSITRECPEDIHERKSKKRSF